MRKMVKGGYERINAPNRRSKQKEMVSELDWRYKISNEREVTNTSPIKSFYHRQHLRYLGHVYRLVNCALQKQVLFDVTISMEVWINVEKVLGIDTLRAWKIMMDKAALMRLVDKRFSQPGAPLSQ